MYIITMMNTVICLYLATVPDNPANLGKLRSGLIIIKIRNTAHTITNPSRFYVLPREGSPAQGALRSSVRIREHQTLKWHKKL